MTPFEYMTVESLEAAAKLLAGQRNGTLLKAGGIDVLDRLKERLDAPRRVVSIREAQRETPAVRDAGDGGLILAATATLAQVAADERVRRDYPALAEAAGHAATPQVRNVATVGGNLCQKPRCWYFRSRDYPCLKKGGQTCFAVHGDNRYHAVFGAKRCHIVHPSNLAVPLVAYAAALRLVRHREGRLAERTVAIDDFFRIPADPQDDEHTLLDGELVAEVRLPPVAGPPRSGYVELREKQSFDWPLVTCAVNLAGRQPRVVLGAVAPIPWRLRAVERVLAAGPPDEATMKQIRKAATFGAEPMSHNAYKLRLIEVAVERAIRAATDGASGTETPQQRS